jgi:phosphoserine aminotransferase
VYLTSNETIEGPAGLAVGVIRRSDLMPCATGLPACLGYQGHRSVGGFRAGISNAMPDERDLARRAG